MISRVLVGIFLLILGWNSLHKSSADSDFRDYYNASQKFSQKEDIYYLDELKDASKKIKSLDEIFRPDNWKLIESLTEGTGSYIYPPSFAFMLIPLANWEYENASKFFSILNYFSLLGSIFLLYLLVIRKMEKDVFFWALAISLFICFRFLENHTNNNQVAFLLLFLIFLSIQVPKSWIAGLFLSLAIVIKLTPAVFLVYFFWKKKWSTLFWTMIWGTFWVFLPGLFFWEENLRYLANWNELVLQSAMSTPLFRAWQNNQSFVATLAKYFLEFADPMNQPQKGMPFFDWEPRKVQIVFYFIFVFFGLSLLKVLYNRFKRPSDLKALSLLFILSVIFSGIAWIHSFSFFIVPVFFVTKEWLEGGLSRYQKYFFFVFGGIVLLSNRNIIGQSGESWALMLSVFLYAGIILYFLVASINNEEDIKVTSPYEDSPVRIAVDARPLAFGVTGNSRYLAEVLKILGKMPHKYKFLLYSHKGIHPVFESIKKLPAVEVISSRSFLPGPIWLHTYFPLASFIQKADILWGTIQLLPAWGKFCPEMVNYHDLNVKSAPQTMARWNYFQHSLFSPITLKNADSILCLSQNTIRDITNYFPKYQEKAVLVYPGVNPIGEESPPKNTAKWGKFFFSLGTLEPRKNLKTLIHSYLKLKEKDPNYPYNLVAAGRTGWGKDEAILESELKQGKYEELGIFFLENPSEGELSWLYKNCSGFLFPSLHEGFGLPLLEAMRENKSCMASDIPVFREILDPDMDRLVSPLDASAWVNALQSWSPERKGRIRDANAWTWENTAQKIEEEIEKLKKCSLTPQNF